MSLIQYRYLLKQDSEPYTNLNLESLVATNFWQESLTLAEQGSLEDALKLIRSHPQGAMQIVLRGDSIRKNLESYLPPMAPPPLTLTRDLEDFTFPAHRDPLIALLIHGPSGFGKTSLASSLIPTGLIISEPEMLKRFNPRVHGGIIFDDCPMPLERETQLALLDNTKDRTIAARKDKIWRCRFSNPFIPMKTSMIILTNVYPTYLFHPLPEIQRRLNVWRAVTFGVFIEDTHWNKVTLL